ncbi:hypothetical protein BDW42DRAFT_76832 [Aspergillus taichungensis]|uniref:Uncharacterized protein n=1 Tax=Aspergillus taichungensis TaxID=482145 RepID=A0A2J5I9L3_9EURO|nr:hypothetical protein BDW42DRAFT_76832 [Aspergillus taichungensis]
MARSLDELHEQTRKLNIRDTSDTSSVEEIPSEDSTQECKCQHSSSTGQCAQCPRHPASQNDAPPHEKNDHGPLNDKKNKESTPDECHPDLPHRCIECKTEEDTTERSPGEESTQLDDGGTARERKGKEAEKEDEQDGEGEGEEEERTLTLEELLEYREKKGLKDGDYLFEFGFGFPEEREVNLNVQIEGDFSVTVLM